MVNQYTIVIENQTGADHTYALFNDYPKVKTDSGTDPKIWSNVFATAKTAATQTATFNVFEQFTAQIGTSEGSAAEGVTVNVQGNEQVTLGFIDQNTGKTVPGTSKGFTSLPDDIPKFSSPDPAAAGSIGSFEFTTDDSFTFQEASESASIHPLSLR